MAEAMAWMRRWTEAAMCGVGAVLLAAAGAAGQCTPELSGWFSGPTGMSGAVLTVYDDDGPGPNPPTLYSVTGAGSFLNVVKWNGLAWDPVGGPITGTFLQVGCLAVLDTDPPGPGPRHPHLYVGGHFDSIGGVRVNGIARLVGAAWVPLGTGIGLVASDDVVRSLAVYDDDGAGPHPPALYVAGQFASAGGIAAANIARWDGSAWGPVGGGVSGMSRQEAAYALAVFDPDGPGPERESLYVGGQFRSAGPVGVSGIARWDGQAWSSVGGGLGGVGGSAALCVALAAFDDDGSGGPPSALYASGFLGAAGGVSVSGLARWDGTTWSDVDGGLSLSNGSPPSGTQLFLFDADGAGPAPPVLVIGGNFTGAGGVQTQNVAQWDGHSWGAFGPGLPVLGSQRELFSSGVQWVDEAGNPTLYTLSSGRVSGDLTNYGAVRRWNGTGWADLRRTVNGAVNALAVLEGSEGLGPAGVVVAGAFTEAAGLEIHQVGVWDGARWHPLGGDFDGPVSAVAVYDDDGPGPHLPALYAGGQFTMVDGVAASSIARWDGTSWSPLGSGVANNSIVSALAVYDDDGDGPHLPSLFVAGGFVRAGGLPCNHLARWDGAAWSSAAFPYLGSNNYALLVADPDGPGPLPPVLYMGGDFQDGHFAYFVAQWDGTTWTSAPRGLQPTGAGVKCLAWYDDDGPGGPDPGRLVVGGDFVMGAFPSYHGPAVLMGASWQPLGPSLTTLTGSPFSLTSLAVVADGSGNGGQPALYVGGSFAGPAGVTSPRLIRWNGSAYSAVGSGAGQTVRALVGFNDGSPDGAQSLYFGGDFHSPGDPGPTPFGRFGPPRAFVRWEPWDQRIVSGDQVQLSVAASGQGPLTYQWRRDGVPLVDGGRVSGTQTTVLTISPAVAADAGGYDVVVTGGCGGTVSRVAMVAVFCRSDIDQSGRSDPVDIALFVSEWVAGLQNGTLEGDFDGNGVVEPADVTAFVTAWLAEVSGGC